MTAADFLRVRAADWEALAAGRDHGDPCAVLWRQLAQEDRDAARDLDRMQGTRNLDLACLGAGL